ncbi:hypothetical protein Q8A67_000119 [Cirrhinus molitorella]|uniref:Uncharacterized protein n=1 Tax=Cirrhinus molitorella TaxID=172907 RepID=A0AA88TZW6_9TELE|nr:hypothetical protein Q8A67_000119 [Cirrhinus molitorella]
MFVPALFISILLRAFSAQAKVVTSFDECKGFFFKDTEPEGMDQNAKKICQMLESDSYSYATLYSVHHRIPLYSAYVFDPDCSSTAGRAENWHVEPQISQPESQTDHMIYERDSDENMIKRYQAVSSDYTNSGYDRGLLNPNSFHCEESRNATFTLTNVAPMDAGFDRLNWKNWESALGSFLRSKLDTDGGSAAVYIVSGTVPGDHVQIPLRGTSEDPERVTVPSHFWTAVCYKHHINDTKSFSFGYVGENQLEGGIRLMTVSELDDQLRELLKTPQAVRIFVDDCFDDSNKINEIQGVFDQLINLPVNQGDQSATDEQSMSRTLKRVVRSSQNPYLTVDKYFCRLDHPCGRYGEDYYWCWTGYGIFDSWDYCSPPLSGTRGTNGQYCKSNYACGTYGSGYNWCYTSDGSEEMCCTSDDCYSAVNDQRCWDNHRCGYHGYSYLWCYTDANANWDYCCKNCIFTAPLKGAYMFNFSIHGRSNPSIPSTAAIVKNGGRVVVAHGYQDQYVVNSSNGVVLILEVGDVVYQQTDGGLSEKEISQQISKENRRQNPPQTDSLRDEASPDSQQYCHLSFSDIHTALRELTATVTEQKANIRALET